MLVLLSVVHVVQALHLSLVAVNPAGGHLRVGAVACRLRDDIDYSTTDSWDDQIAEQNAWMAKQLRNQPPRMQYGVPPQNEQFGAPAQAQAQQIADNMVAVTAPDGVYAGQEFYLIFNGMQIPVICPQGCGPGMNINLELDVSGFGGVGPNGSPQQQVQVTVPDGCFAGMFFTVDFGSGPFNVEVPEGYGPGMTFPVNMA